MAISRGTASVGSAFDPKAYHGGPAKKLSLDDFTKKMMAFGPEGPPPGFDPRAFAVDESTLPPTGKTYRGPGVDIDYGPKKPEPMPTFETPPSYEIPEMSTPKPADHGISGMLGALPPGMTPKTGSGKMYSRGKEFVYEEPEETEFARLTRLRREADPRWDIKPAASYTVGGVGHGDRDSLLAGGRYHDRYTIGGWKPMSGEGYKGPRDYTITEGDRFRGGDPWSPESLKYGGKLAKGTFMDAIGDRSSADELRGEFTDEAADEWIRGITGITPSGRFWRDTPEAWAASGRDPASLERGRFIGRMPAPGDKATAAWELPELSGIEHLSAAKYAFLPDDYTITETGGIGGYRHPTSGVGLAGWGYDKAAHESDLRRFYGDDVYEGLRTRPSERVTSTRWLTPEEEVIRAREMGWV